MSMKTIVCTAAEPWDGKPQPGKVVLHPDARRVDEPQIERRCPNCGFEWKRELWGSA